MTRGVLGAFKRKEDFDYKTICQRAHRIAVLENIADATNLGAIFRSAAALGIDAVLLTPECADPLCRCCSDFLGIGKKADLKRKNQKKYVFSVM